MKKGKVIRLSASLLGMLACFSLVFTVCGSATAAAQKDWKPSKPVNVITGFAAGGGMDTLARAVASYINLDGQTMYVTNVVGGGGNIGGMEAFHAKPDGHTLYIGSPQANVCNFLSGGLKANLNEKMIYIACIAEDVNVLTVRADSPYKSFEELVAVAKKNPGKLTMASVGSGNSMEASATDIFLQADIKLTYVPYDSASKSRTAVLGANADMLWSQLAEAKSQIDAGELRILAIASEKRVNFYPDVPTFMELGVKTSSAISRSFLLPPGADEAIARYYDKKLAEVFNNEKFRTTVQDRLGYVLEYTDFDGMKAKAATLQKWGEKIMPLIL